MAEHVDRLDAPVLIGVGAAFDFHAGLKTQAPRWMQQSGLEWLFRLATEPRRLWRRYLHEQPGVRVAGAAGALPGGRPSALRLKDAAVAPATAPRRVA